MLHPKNKVHTRRCVPKLIGIVYEKSLLIKIKIFARSFLCRMKYVIDEGYLID